MNITLDFATKTITINEDTKVSDLVEILKKHNIGDDYKIVKTNIINSITCTCNKYNQYTPTEFWYTTSQPHTGDPIKPYCTSNNTN